MKKSSEEKHMKVVYVAGPFRAASTFVPGHQDMFAVQQNVMRAMELSLEVWRLGAVAVCPHSNTMFFTGSAEDKVWLDGDLELLARCDAVLMTPDWAKSSGARAEEAFAKKKGVPVFYKLDSVRDWLAGKAAWTECRVCNAQIATAPNAINVCGRCLVA